MDFSFLEEVGQKIFDELNQDPDNANWINEIYQYYLDNDSYPEDLSSELLDRLVKLMNTDRDNIITDLRNIIANETDNIDYFYDQIFNRQETYLEEEAEAEDDKIDNEPSNSTELIIQDEPTEEFDESSLSPEKYFEYHIEKLATEFSISTDLSYLLLNHFFWNYDKIKEFWLYKEKEKQELFKKFRLIEKNGHLHNLREPLRMKRTDQGECSICCSTEDLYELYCGHVLCSECIVQEIDAQVKDNSLPVCRCEIEEGQGRTVLCEAELMPSDVKNLLNASCFQLYRRVFLNKEIDHNKNVRYCPNPFCGWIITPANRLPCNIGRCYNCNAVTCLLNKHDSHAPLRKCELVDKFKIEIAGEMKQLEQDQDSWMAREIRLKDYRHSHSNEVKKVLDNEIKELENKQQKERSNEYKKIEEIDKEINEINIQVSSFQNKLKESNLSSNEISRINDRIKYLKDDINKLKSRKKLFQDTSEHNQQERQKDLDTAKTEAFLFLEAIQDLSFYEINMDKFKQSQNTRAYSGIKVTQSDEEYIKMISRNCPKCNTLISRDEGCNEMTCPVCHFHFCWICSQPWDEKTHKKSFFQCPNQKLFNQENATNRKSNCGIDFSDLNDKKFYPQPMTMEKRTNLIRFNNLNNKFKENQEKYDRIFKSLMNRNNDVDLSKVSLKNAPFDKLCKLKRIEKVYLNCDNSQIIAMRIINTALFAQSVIMWSYPTLYFMSSNIEKARIFEYQVSELQKSTDQLLKYMINPSKCSRADFDNIKNLIDRQIQNICDEADIST